MATAESFIEELKGLLTRNMEANTQLASRVSALVQQASREGVPANANDLFARWLDFNIASATLMTSHSSQVARGLVDAAERALLGRTLSSAAQSPGDDGGVAPAAAPGAIDLHVQGGPGETVRAPFLIANEYDRPLEVSFEASALRSEGGAEIPVDQVSFEPPSLSLGRGQRVVQAAIAIPAGARPGSTYRGDVRVKGYQAQTIAIAVSVNAPVGDVGEAMSGRGAGARRVTWGGAPERPTKGKRKRTGGGIGMTRRRARGAGLPALPCLTIARSPANDVRVIVDAFVSTPVLVQLLTDRGGLIRDHRAELRAMLQQLSGKLAAAIERPAGVAEEVAQLAARAGALVTAPGEGSRAPAHEDSGPSPRPAGRSRQARRAAPSRLLASATPSAADGVDWCGGRLLR